ncbi:MAG: hypothetical protein Q9183_002148 [Haloplaca sp. 2 TL-2023]
MAVDTTVKSEVLDGDFKGDLDVNNNLPSRKDVNKVADLPVLDSSGKPHAFKTLYTPSDNSDTSRTLIIFIRHFFCGNCQEYLRSLSSSINSDVLKSISPPTNIRIVGCGDPELIAAYVRETECPYPIYADPSKALYTRLGMARTLSLGSKAPQYMQYSLPSAIIRSVYQGLKSGRLAFKGGDYWQVGGEFLMEDGEAIWCHRMTNTRDHAEVPELRRQLGLDGARPPLRKTFTSGIRRSSSQLRRNLSDRRKSWSRSRDRTEKSSPDGSMMEKVKEDSDGEERSENEEVNAEPKTNGAPIAGNGQTV